MKAAFPYWNNRLAPLFDTAQWVAIVEAAESSVNRLHFLSENRERMPLGVSFCKVNRLTDLKVDTLVCGAVSKPVHDLLTGNGIEVVPFVAGELQVVIDAWLNGELAQPQFNMPGCSGRQRGGGFKRRCRGGKRPFRSDSDTIDKEWR